jgi:cholesterol transport system auxiliary component
MTLMHPFRPLLITLLLPVLAGCGALGAITDASAPKDAYTLSAPGAGPSVAPGSRHLVVELPTSAGAMATDRIQIKPVAYQAQYLPDGAWSEPAPTLVQTLLVASFQNIGGFRLVGRSGAGLMPDYTLMTELQEFHAEPAGATPAPLTIRISAMMTLIRESDRRIVATRRFTATDQVASDDTDSIVRGFDSALQPFLHDVVQWTATQAR